MDYKEFMSFVSKNPELAKALVDFAQGVTPATNPPPEPVKVEPVTAPVVQPERTVRKRPVDVLRRADRSKKTTYMGKRVPAWCVTILEGYYNGRVSRDDTSAALGYSPNSAHGLYQFLRTYGLPTKKEYDTGLGKTVEKTLEKAQTRVEEKTLEKLNKVLAVVDGKEKTVVYMGKEIPVSVAYVLKRFHAGEITGEQAGEEMGYADVDGLSFVLWKYGLPAIPPTDPAPVTAPEPVITEERKPASEVVPEVKKPEKPTAFSVGVNAGLLKPYGPYYIPNCPLETLIERWSLAVLNYNTRNPLDRLNMPSYEFAKAMLVEKGQGPNGVPFNKKAFAALWDRDIIRSYGL